MKTRVIRFLLCGVAVLASGLAAQATITGSIGSLYPEPDTTTAAFNLTMLASAGGAGGDWLIAQGDQPSGLNEKLGGTIISTTATLADVVYGPYGGYLNWTYTDGSLPTSATGADATLMPAAKTVTLALPAGTGTVYWWGHNAYDATVTATFSGDGGSDSVQFYNPDPNTDLTTDRQAQILFNYLVTTPQTLTLSMSHPSFSHGAFNSPGGWEGVAVTFDDLPVPEPSTALLLAVGGWLVWRRRTKS